MWNSFCLFDSRTFFFISSKNKPWYHHKTYSKEVSTANSPNWKSKIILYLLNSASAFIINFVRYTCNVSSCYEVHVRDIRHTVTISLHEKPVIMQVFYNIHKKYFDDLSFLFVLFNTVFFIFPVKVRNIVTLKSSINSDQWMALGKLQKMSFAHVFDKCSSNSECCSYEELLYKMMLNKISRQITDYYLNKMSLTFTNRDAVE